MIEVQDLTKTFGERTAVDHISFAVNKGEILGFLGPNGAGKTTTMRMLTSFMPATSGTARIAGFDVFDNSLEVRRHIGYLPENPPVYPDMTVESYLDFVARIKGVPVEKRAQRVTDALEKTNITDKRDELIKRLSRGYKQRVGLAQALVHDPDVIILDEPTVGLDPKQIIEVRHLIKNLAGSHTIVLSTHILPEVNMTCRRVVIIDRGRIVAQDTPEQLTAKLQGSDQTLITVAGPSPAVREALTGVKFVQRLEDRPVEGGSNGVCSSVAYSTGHGDEVRSALAACVVQHGWSLLEVKAMALSLEDLFMRLVTKEERV